MTKDAIGKGRAAIFEGLGQTPDTSHQSQVTSEEVNQPPATSHHLQIDESILVQALAEAKESPKITVFSPKVAAVLRYKQLTTIRYSFSTEARERLEQTVKDAYPDLWEAVEKALAKK